MDALEAIMTRRSVRSYTGEPIAQEQLRQIVAAGMQAPSAHDKRPWQMLTITDRETMRGLIPLSPWWGLLETAAVAIVVCSDTRGQEDISHEFQVDGCAAATQNMLLATHAMGLGGVWLGVCEGEDNCHAFRKHLAISDYAKVVSMIAVGHPTEPVKPVDNMDSTKWFEDRWGHTVEDK